MSRHIAFYGKAGAGKSTIATAVAAALSGAGRRILLVGCDPHSESTLLLRGERAPALVELLEDGKDAMERAVTVGFNGVRCIELGNLFRAGGCAGTAIYTAFSAIYDSEAYRSFDPEYVFYDCPGDLLCEGLAMPIRDSLVDTAYVVTSADLVSLQGANNIFRTIARHAPEGGAKLGGVIANGLTTPFSEGFIGDFAARTHTRVVACLPRSVAVLQSELHGKTVLEGAPNSHQSFLFRKLSTSIAETRNGGVPLPLEPVAMRTWARYWGDRVLELQTGVVSDHGSGI